MLKIAICDDEKEHRKEINDAIMRVLFDKAELSVEMFSDGEDIIALIENDLFNFDLIFLDINMPVVNGMSAAKAIRDNRLPTDIIFITSHPEYVFEGYIYKAFSFLVKPVSLIDITRELLRYYNEREEFPSNYLLINFNGIRQKININRIEYLESSKRKVLVSTGSECFEFYARLDDICERGAGSLIRTHQSFMVNPDRIVSLTHSEVMLAGGKVIPVSKKYYAGVCEAFSCDALCFDEPYLHKII